MNFREYVPLLLLLVLCASCSRTEQKENVPGASGTFHVRLTDAYGEAIDLDRQPERVISLAPNLTEIVCFLGGENRLVARTDYCDYPPSVRTLPSVGTLGSYNYEQIVALKPDLVLMMTFDGSSRGEYDRLKALGLRPFALSEGMIDRVIDGIDTVGNILGLQEVAAARTDSLRAIVKGIRGRADSSTPVTTFIVIDKSPLMTTSGGFIGSLVEAAGGENIAKDDPIAYPLYSRELLMRKRPDIILIPATSDDISAELLELYPEWEQLQAEGKARLRTVPVNLIARPGPRIVEGLQQVFDALH